MRKGSIAAIVTFAAIGSSPWAPLLPAQQDATTTAITITAQNQDRARDQLRRLLSAYDLDPWIFTTEVRIVSGVDPHSHPVLTLNADFLDHDEMQLSIFLHEQVHWFVSRSVPPRAPESGDDVTIIRELRQLYPNAPVPDHNAYLHLIVAWLELDAMAELVGEDRARHVLTEKVQRLMLPPLSRADERYRWYNTRVLEDTLLIGAILAKHDMLITPDRGLLVATGGR